MVKHIIQKNKGFTLIELLVVLAIIAMLVSMASPKFFKSLERSKETALRHDLSVMRNAISQFYSDQSRYPQSMQELVQAGYLKAIPVDPVLNRSDTWILLSPPIGSSQSGLYDVISGSPDVGLDGTPYSNY